MFPSISTPRVSKKWNECWIEKPKPSSVPGMGEKGRVHQANPSIRSNSGRASSWHLAKITQTTHSSVSASSRLFHASHLCRQSAGRETVVAASHGQSRNERWRGRMAGKQRWEVQQDTRECQEFYFRVSCTASITKPTQKQKPKPTFNAGYFRSILYCPLHPTLASPPTPRLSPSVPPE